MINQTDSRLDLGNLRDVKCVRFLVVDRDASLSLGRCSELVDSILLVHAVGFLDVDCVLRVPVDFDDSMLVLVSIVVDQQALYVVSDCLSHGDWKLIFGQQVRVAVHYMPEHRDLVIKTANCVDHLGPEVLGEHKSLACLITPRCCAEH